MTNPDELLAAIDSALADNDAAHRQEQAEATRRAFTEGVALLNETLADMWTEIGPALTAAAEAIRDANRAAALTFLRPPRTINPHGHRTTVADRRHHWGGHRG